VRPSPCADDSPLHGLRRRGLLRAAHTSPRRGVPRPLRSAFAVSHDLDGLIPPGLRDLFQPHTPMGFGVPVPRRSPRIAPRTSLIGGWFDWSPGYPVDGSSRRPFRAPRWSAETVHFLAPEVAAPRRRRSSCRGIWSGSGSPIVPARGVRVRSVASHRRCWFPEGFPRRRRRTSRRTSAPVRSRRPRDVSRRSRRLGSSVEQALLTHRARSRPGWLLVPVSDRPSACYRVRGAGPTGVGSAAPPPRGWSVVPAAPASAPPLGNTTAYVFWLLPTAAPTLRSACPPRCPDGPSGPACDRLPAPRTVVLL